MTDKEFVDDWRTINEDHLPDGYPCVKTRDINRLIAIIDQLTIERDETKKNHGYSCHVCGALRTECEIMKRTSDDKRVEVAERCTEIVDDVVQSHRWGNDGSCGVNSSIKAAIKGEFGLSD